MMSESALVVAVQVYYIWYILSLELLNPVLQTRLERHRAAF